MIYRLYIETVQEESCTGWAFMFFNHQDFNIYKRCGKSETTDKRAVILTIAEQALSYFTNFMRRRYYDEHFATILDEDYVTLFTELPEIEACWKSGHFREFFADAPDRARWETLLPYFERPTMRFETASDPKFIEAVKVLAKKGLAQPIL